MTVKIIFNNTNINNTSIIQMDQTTNAITGINISSPTSTIELIPTGWSTAKLNAMLTDFVKSTFTMTDGQSMAVQIMVDDVLQITMTMTASGVNYNVTTQAGDAIMTITTLNVDTLIQLFKLSSDLVIS